MIKLLDDLCLLDGLSEAEPYTACLFMAEGVALLPEPDLMDIWVELDEGGKPLSAVKVDSKRIALLCPGLPGMEMLFFITKLAEGGIKSIACGEGALPVLKSLFPGRAEELSLMRCSKLAETEEPGFEIKVNENLDGAFELLWNAGEEDEAPSRELWMLKIKRGIAKGQITVLTVEVDGKAVSTATIRGRTKSAGAISSVATLQEYRRRGYASALTAACSKILFDEHRESRLVPANEKVQKLYERLGFAQTGKCYILHLDEKEETK